MFVNIKEEISGKICKTEFFRNCSDIYSLSEFMFLSLCVCFHGFCSNKTWCWSSVSGNTRPAGSYFRVVSFSSNLDTRNYTVQLQVAFTVRQDCFITIKKSLSLLNYVNCN